MIGYLTYFRSELLTKLQYRTAAFAGIATQFFWGIIYALIYTTFYSYTNIDTININELMSYVWLNQAFIMIIYLSIKDPEINESIITGTVGYELCKPYDLYVWWFIKILSKRYASTMLRCLPILVFSFFLPAPYNLSLPNSFLSLLLFFITLILGSFLIVAINMIVQIITFYTYQDKGVTSIVYSLGGLFSGFYLPLPLLPKVLVRIADFLPFRFIGDLSFRVYSGNIDINTGLQCILIQIAWIIVLIIIGEMLLRFTLKKVSIQGG